MEINRDNYEVYFLDYAEGNLSSAEKEILYRFLRFNPDLSLELDAFSLQPILQRKEEFPNKEMLKKKFPGNNDIVSSADFEMFCIAYLEGDLTNEQKASYLVFLSEHPEFQVQHDLIKATFLQQDSVLFPNKSSLKRRKPIIINWKIMMPLAAAAAILMMFIIGPSVQTESTEFAIAEIPENTNKVIDPPAEEKKPTEKAPQATLTVIRGSKAPVPVSDYKKMEHDDLEKTDESNKDASEPNEKSEQIASIDLRTTKIAEVGTRYDQINIVPVQSPAIHQSSLSAFDLLKYQFQKASSAMEEEDVFIWSLASTGLKELNKLTGTNVQLLASRDEDGSISGIQFKSRYLKITTPISREN